jgi:glycosyltransferase involved in cell wall biosynthesis
MVSKPLLDVIVSHPIQYQAPLWRALAADGRLAVRVLYLSRYGVERRLDPGFGHSYAWDIDLLSGYESSFVRNLRNGAAPGRFTSHINPGIVAALMRPRPDAVLFVGARNPSALVALAAARAAAIPRLYRADSSVLELGAGLRPQAAAGILRAMSVVLSAGTANDLYYERLGIPPERRVLAPYSVDNEFFRGLAIERNLARAQLGIGADEFVVLFAGKLLPHKDPIAAVEACAATGGGLPTRLVIAGDGELRRAVQDRATALGVPLTLLGFVNQRAMGQVYSAADVLVVPSRREPWGLVINEAMNFSLPVLASTRVGAWLDLVHRGANGEVFAAGDPRALATVLRALASDRQMAAAWGGRSRSIIKDWGIPATVEGVVAGVHTALAERAR